nr:hypothetical transcript [Hymenolepis microstoma]
MIEKEGYWVPHELKPRRRFFPYEQLLERQKRKEFLHRIVTGDEKWVHHDNPNSNPSAENHGECPMIILLRQHLDRISMAQNTCFAGGGGREELQKPSKTITDSYRPHRVVEDTFATRDDKTNLAKLDSLDTYLQEVAQPEYREYRPSTHIWV